MQLSRLAIAYIISCCFEAVLFVFSALFQKTADNAAQQTENIKNMKNSIDEISRSISDNSAVAQESSATSEQLAAQASVLNQLLEKFEF